MNWTWIRKEFKQKIGTAIRIEFKQKIDEQFRHDLNKKLNNFMTEFEHFIPTLYFNENERQFLLDKKLWTRRKLMLTLI